MLNKKDLIYQVTREGGTEPPFSGEHVDNKKIGKKIDDNFSQKVVYSHLSQCTPGIFNLDQKFHGLSCFCAFMYMRQFRIG